MNAAQHNFGYHVARASLSLFGTLVGVALLVVLLGTASGCAGTNTAPAVEISICSNSAPVSVNVKESGSQVNSSTNSMGGAGNGASVPISLVPKTP